MAPTSGVPVPDGSVQQQMGSLYGNSVSAVTNVAPPMPKSATMFDQLSSNPMFAAGFGIVGLTAGLAIARKSFIQVTSLIQRQMLVTLEIPNKDRSYEWFLHWMSVHQRAQALDKSAKHGIISRIQPGTRNLAVETALEQHPNGSYSTTFALVPGPGKHILNFRDTLISVDRTRDTKALDRNSGKPWETVTLTTLYKDRGIFPELLREAQTLAMQLAEGKTVIFTSWGTEWRPFGPPRRKRPLSSVVLGEGLKEKIVADVHDFLGSSKWYYDRGIPYRRGYLLYGPPGTGKSSFIQSLAGELDYNICVLNLSERGLTDDRLNHLLTNLPDRAILLLEDIDAAFSNRTQSDEHGYRGANVTYSGLLNALDGVASAEERIVFLTTNYRGRLDPALVRPGRVDLSIELGWATPYQVRVMWDRFYGPEALPSTLTGTEREKAIEHRAKLREEFIARLTEAGLLGEQVNPRTPEEMREAGEKIGEHEGKRGVSTAMLQGLFVYNKGDPEGALEGVKEFLVAG